LSSKGATIQLQKELKRDDNLLFAEGGSRIIFSIDKTKEKEWLSYLKNIQINSPSSVYVKKIGFVSSEDLIIKIKEKNICNIRVEELTEKFNNSISGYF
jgi:phosphoribosylformylglycinamidine synthase